MSGPVISFYADDFTGAAENLAQFHAHGLRSRLYFEPADCDRVLAEAPNLDVVGIAGVARSCAPAEMRPLLRNAFTLFSRLGSRLNQYKICSTFDSSLTIGNFAVAVEEALRIWPDALLPVLPATPDFGRYTAFANHFSRHRDEILRLDRNPALVAHPSTPMHEADLRLHLDRLGLTLVAAVMLPELSAAPEALARLIAERGEASTLVVLDTVDNVQLRHICSAIWDLARQRDLFCLAAQGLPQGIGGVIAKELGRSPNLSIAGIEEPGLVLSGSCARQTAIQLEAAEAAGWTLIRLPVEELASPEAAEQTVAAIAGQMLRALSDRRSTAIYTARGSATQDFEAERAQAVGNALSGLFREAVRHAGQRRVIFAGGDTSSFAMRATGAYALEIAGSTGRQASHVCRLLAEDELNEIEVILKGGQAGGDHFFLDPLL
jgi:3-oxoisoapionate kinase